MSNTAYSNNREKTKKIPWSLGLLFISVVYLSGSHFFRFIQVLINLQILRSLELTVTPFYLAADGLVWGTGFLVFAAGILTRKSWAMVMGSVLSCLYAVYFWIDQIFISQPAFLARRWTINLLFTILGLSATLWVLNHKTIRVYFGKNPVKIA